MTWWGNKNFYTHLYINIQKQVIICSIRLWFQISGDFVTDLGSKEGIEFEDPFQKYEGETQFRVFLNMAKKYVSSVEFELHKKYQGTDEILLDWTLTMANTMMPDWPLVMPMRTHIILSKAGKVKRISEEWYGNEQINEANTFFLWGRMHMKLRKFIGTMAVESVNRGWI